MEAAAAVGRETQHSLTIAASPSIVNWPVPELLRAVEDEQLGVTGLPLEVETGQMVEAVESGRADMCICHQVGEQGSVQLRRLATLPLDPPAFILLDVVWSKNASRQEERILQILVEIQRGKSPGTAPSSDRRKKKAGDHA